MIGKEDLVKDTIENPVRVHEGNTATSRVFRGATIASGFWKGSHPHAIVEYRKNGVGYLKTAYLATSEPKGKVVPKP